MKKPLSANFSDIASIALVQKSLEGDKNGLNQLIKIHIPIELPSQTEEKPFNY
jgi:hypothetical protein